jgi:Phage virion morphogenesis family
MAETWVGIEFSVMGETQVSRQLQMARGWSEDLHEPLSQMMDLILANVRAQFDTEGAQGEHGRWQPLSDAYSKWKERHWPGRPILVRSGGMKGAMLNPAYVHVGTERALYEPKSNIAGFHQKGATWVGPNWGHPQLSLHHLPARPMVDLTDSFKHEAVDRTFARWIARKLAEGRAAGRGFH